MLSNIAKKQTNAFSSFKFCALTLTLAASLAAQTTTAPAPKSAPWDDVDAAKTQQAKDPLGADGLRYATANKLQLGGSPDDSFAVVNAMPSISVLIPTDSSRPYLLSLRSIS